MGVGSRVQKNKVTQSPLFPALQLVEKSRRIHIKGHKQIIQLSISSFYPRGPFSVLLLLDQSDAVALSLFLETFSGLLLTSLSVPSWSSPASSSSFLTWKCWPAPGHGPWTLPFEVLSLPG